MKLNELFEADREYTVPDEEWEWSPDEAPRVDGDQFIDRSETGMSFFDNLMQNPMYHRNYKGYEYSIEAMTPKEYFDAISKARGRSANLRGQEKELAEEYAAKMLDGEKFPMPTLRYNSEGYLDQEGRHRAYAAMLAGADHIPVMIVKELPSEKRSALSMDWIKGRR